MFDAKLRRLIDPPMNALGQTMVSFGISANQVTTFGLILGVVAAILITQHFYLWGLAFLLLSRIMDGLDGAVARASQKTDFGGYLDIVFDFIFYGLIPLSFAVADPAKNAVAASVLLMAFYANGASFLAYAIMAEKRGITTQSHGSKSLYFTGGLAEAGETFAVFAAFCLFPTAFAWIAYGFALITAITTISRIILAKQVFQDRTDAQRDETDTGPEQTK